MSYEYTFCLLLEDLLLSPCNLIKVTFASNRDESFLTVQQITGIMEYIPTLEERKALNRFVESGQDIGILCECEKFMVSIMNVKEAKKKMKAMLFKLHFPVMVNDVVKCK